MQQEYTQEELNGCHWCVALANSHTAKKLGFDHERIRDAVLGVHEDNNHASRRWPAGKTADEAAAIATAAITITEME